MGRLAKTTVVIIEGQPYKLLLDMNAMVAFEEVTGENFFAFAERGTQEGFQPTSKELRALLWAEMLHEQPTLTLQEVGAMITAADLAPICMAVLQAQKEATPESNADEQLDPNPTSLQTG